jgi:enoyl-CoA hydratase/carnithine racemase
MAAVELTTVGEGIALITMNRPERLNAIDGELMDGMYAAIDEVSNINKWRVAILTGQGRGFCAGADLSGTGKAWVPQARTRLKTNFDMQERCTNMFTEIYESPTPFIAAVNGAAVGGGLAFALHCDVRIASTEARFGSAFIKAGFSSMDMGTSYLLPRIVGAGAAREMMLTGRVVESEEAFRIGLVHEVTAPGSLIDDAVVMANRIAANNHLGVWQTKIGLNAALDAPGLRHAKMIEDRIQMLTAFTGNPAEAAKALMEKRTATWEEL